MRNGLLCLMVALLAIGCSSDEDSGIKIYGDWELRHVAKGWSIPIEFDASDVVFAFHENGTLEVFNNSNIDLSPFVSNVDFPFRIEQANLFINGERYEYSIENQSLRISQNSYADGSLYIFNRIKK